MKLLDSVTTLLALPEHRVQSGQVGTVVELLDSDTVLVEFAGENGVAYAIVPLYVSQLSRLDTR